MSFSSFSRPKGRPVPHSPSVVQRLGSLRDIVPIREEYTLEQDAILADLDELAPDDPSVASESVDHTAAGSGHEDDQDSQSLDVTLESRSSDRPKSWAAGTGAPPACANVVCSCGTTSQSHAPTAPLTNDATADATSAAYEAVDDISIEYQDSWIEVNSWGRSVEEEARMRSSEGERLRGLLRLARKSMSNLLDPITSSFPAPPPLPAVGSASPPGVVRRVMRRSRSSLSLVFSRASAQPEPVLPSRRAGTEVSIGYGEEAGQNGYLGTQLELVGTHSDAWATEVTRQLLQLG